MDNQKMILNTNKGAMDYYYGESFPFDGGIGQVVWSLSVDFDKGRKMNMVKLMREVEVERVWGKCRQWTFSFTECNNVYKPVEMAGRKDSKRLLAIFEEIATPEVFEVIKGIEQNRTSPMGDNCVVYLNQHCKDLAKRIDAKQEAQKIEKALSKKKSKAQPTDGATKDAKRL